MIQHKVCASCKGCCRYDDYEVTEFSEETLQQHFCFNRHLSQTFFPFDKQKNKFIMGKFCQHYNDFHCDIYNKIEKYILHIKDSTIWLWEKETLRSLAALRKGVNQF